MRPNILLIRVDAAIGRFYFSEKLKLNWIEKIKKDGISFKNCYSVSTISHPSQTSIDTGVFPHKHGILGNRTEGCYKFKLKENIYPIGQILKENGYLTGKSGQGEGNDKNYDIDLSIPYPVYAKKLEEKGFKEQTLPEKTFKYCGRLPYGIEDTREGVYAKNAIKIIEEFSKKGKPWFIYCCFDGPHPPCKIPYPFDELYKPENIDIPFNWNLDIEKKPVYYKKWKERMNLDGNLNEYELRILVSHYWGFYRLIDEVFGWIIEKLENLKIYSDTLIVFTSDHGGMVGNFGIVYHGGPILCEDAIKVPLFISYPEKFQKGKIIDEFVSTVDILPTILNISGIKFPDYLDGNSLLPLIEGKGNNWRKSIFFEWNSDGKSFLTLRGIRDKKFKFIYSPFTDGEFYDVEKDPFEKENLSIEDVPGDLKKEMLEWMKKTDDYVYEIAEKDLKGGIK